ncbi:alpha/beta fold hydrolase [Tsukamurella ocularis]|uniref:alpha/beta fold hydrolase n=1 Tax=Tsukamurella ocularis TaxID=1970234 RepID=UPI00216A195F|nr:alpha/beta hydrolase [Tsukamurella ocularis]MCS3779024.1 pimeloyl-ACP methyl ester carboxylesterase [Tsukamurella ocularis]MCS3787356.1 pimeloyl-ACP methyl ester carboxylesterase [Tsukamurella ocularis]MCS3851707.1 pimeloyl-ACP methyl ester carboxylesterase [Tsukamurella ocularis]
MGSPEPDDEDGAVESAIEWIDASSHLDVGEGLRIAYRRRGEGPAIVLLHGFPTWSYDYAIVADDLSRDHTVITLDFLGYGASDKPRNHQYSVASSADAVAAVLATEQITAAWLVVHDYGSIVAQEILDRRRRAVLPYSITGVDVLNSGIVYAAYRPTQTQRALSAPIVGALLARLVSRRTLKHAVDGVRAHPTSEAEFDELWVGIARFQGHRITDRLLGYNAERAVHHTRWETALKAWEGPLHLIWGLEDPVSGAHVLAAAQEQLPQAKITRLEGVGHFPQSEAPAAVLAALRSHLYH